MTTRQFTAEDRIASAAARAEKKAHAAAHLRSDFLDAEEWERLARVYSVRLPQWAAPCTTASMERWLRKVGIAVTAYKEWGNFKAMEDFPRLNPHWPLRAFVGLMLEERARKDEQRKEVMQ